MEKFLAAVRNMFNVPDLRRRILFTLGILAIYRLGAHVSAPGINKARLDQVWHDVSGTLLGVSLLSLRFPRFLAWPLAATGALYGGLGVLRAARSALSDRSP